MLTEVDKLFKNMVLCERIAWLVQFNLSFGHIWWSWIVEIKKVTKRIPRDIGDEVYYM